MSEMIERVARAVSECLSGRGSPVVDTDRLIARAAIEAMREPTEAMIEAPPPRREHWVWDDQTTVQPEDITDIYRAMIDEALK